jgi:hypothetical protein
VAGRLKLQRFLIAAGFVIAALGQGVQSWAVSYGAPGSYGWSNQIFGTAYLFGYGLLAWASWVWFRWIEDLPTPGVSLNRVLKLAGMANLAFAIGLLAVTYNQARDAITVSYSGRLIIAVAVTEGFQFVGFCLVSVGFWSAGSRLGTSASVGNARADGATLGNSA